MTGGPAGGRLVLRADAGGAIGTGHAMRLLALAQAWIDRGGSVDWLVAEAPEAIVARYAAEGAAVRRLAAAYPDPGDATSVVAAIAADPAARAVVDGPAFDATYLDALAAVADRVAVVDDMAALPRYPVATVVNQNAHADRTAYPPATGARFLLGLDHAMLRREFRAAARPAPTIRARAGRLLVTFGGADPTGMTRRAIRALATLGRRAAGLDVHAIVGAANPDFAAIEREAAASPLVVTLSRSVEDMAEAIAGADLAVVSAGSTVWELARMGVPALVVETAPPEAHLARGLARLGLFDLLGPENRLDETSLIEAVEARLTDAAWRARMSHLGRSLVDGRGADRVAAAIAGGPGSDR